MLIILTLILISDLHLQGVASGCPENIDEYSLIWKSAVAGKNVTLPCPNGTGIAFRYCDSSGKWQQPNITECRSTEYAQVAKQAQQLNGSELDNVTVVTKQLIHITKPTANVSRFARDLAAIVDALDALINITDSSNIIKEDDFVTHMVKIHDNILDESNVPGWIQLTTVVHEQCELLLLNIERFGTKLAHTLNVTQSKKITGDNIVISVDAISSDNITAVNWPDSESRNNGLFRNKRTLRNHLSASIMIPADFVQKIGQSSENGKVLVANLAYKNFAPPSIYVNDSSGTLISPVSIILSSKVSADGMALKTSKVQSNEPITLTFGYSLDGLEDKTSNIRCGFWDKDLYQGSYFIPGGWSDDGLSVEAVDGQTIKCTSKHLTSFAVLVDVSGSHKDVSATHRKALSIVSYVGCIICLICLMAAIILFVIYRIPLLKEIHNFVHLNLTIALFLAIFMFVIGIETAVGNRVACTMVAVILHYFFTSVFTWMLCEGIMLYFLLIKVFYSGLGQRKLFYLSLGWGLPAPIVAIAVGIAYEHYGTEDYCWLSTTNGTIWAFAGPVLFIITVNVIFLGMTLFILVQNEKFISKESSHKHLKLVRHTIKAAIILLPLLGITWVFGFLAVNKESMAFAWTFTFLNSLQGAFILVLHVIRNKKVRSSLEKFYKEHTGKIFSTAMSQGQDNSGTLKSVNMIAISSKTGHTVGSDGGNNMNGNCSSVELPSNQSSNNINGILEPTIADEDQANN